MQPNQCEFDRSCIFLISHCLVRRATNRCSLCLTWIGFQSKPHIVRLNILCETAASQSEQSELLATKHVMPCYASQQQQQQQFMYIFLCTRWALDIDNVCCALLYFHHPILHVFLLVRAANCLFASPSVYSPWIFVDTRWYIYICIWPHINMNNMCLCARYVFSINMVYYNYNICFHDKLAWLAIWMFGMLSLFKPFRLLFSVVCIFFLSFSSAFVFYLSFAWLLVDRHAGTRASVLAIKTVDKPRMQCSFVYWWWSSACLHRTHNTNHTHDRGLALRAKKGQ